MNTTSHTNAPTGGADVLRVLILCTGNSARSIMAEGAINGLGQGRVRAYSAGSRPTGQVHPLALAELARAGYPASAPHSKSWDCFAQADSPPMDFVITVCDNAAGEVCPVWPGQPQRAHWSLPDPAAPAPSPAAQEAAFGAVFAEILRRVHGWLGDAPRQLSPEALAERLRAIPTHPAPGAFDHAAP
jgi:arsenate reductase